ncbi:MAG: hypothetical protein QNJ54_30250 [Prochloraceae cyanobacterium]|nr:hypothetical protein [Prochloraceae cyanobacterium]
MNSRLRSRLEMLKLSTYWQRKLKAIMRAELVKVFERCKNLTAHQLIREKEFVESLFQNAG